MQQRFLLQILFLAQHVSGITMPIVRSSRVLYSGCCLWYFVLWFSSCWSGVELRVMCLVCRMLQSSILQTRHIRAAALGISTLACICIQLLCPGSTHLCTSDLITGLSQSKLRTCHMLSLFLRKRYLPVAKFSLP